MADPDVNRKSANHLANHFASRDARDVLKRLYLSGIQLKGVSGDNTLTTGNEHIGIWRKDHRRSAYTRDTAKVSEWPFWANVPIIPEEKRAKFRIVFLGESVARAFLLDPAFTVAEALRKTLERDFGFERFEIIDLARTNLGFDAVELARAAKRLNPDLVIVFGGNNWKPTIEDNDLLLVENILKLEGIPGLKRYLEQKLARSASSAISNIMNCYEADNIPVIWVVPEFNLADWSDDTKNAPYLRGKRNSDWLAKVRCADDCFRAQDLDKATSIAEELVQIDGGVCSKSLRLLGQCHIKSGRVDLAREYLERAKDASVWDVRGLYTPRPYSLIQQIMRSLAFNPSAATVVDLPEMFRDYLDGQLPDRRLFFDYCHLTVLGIQIAVAGMASAIAARLCDSHLKWRHFFHTDVRPSAKYEAEGAFMAAIHNAHWHQSTEIVEHYCSHALQCDQEVGNLMIQFMEMEAIDAPILLSGAGAKLLTGTSALVQKYLSLNSESRLDVTLSLAIGDALSKNSGTQVMTLFAERQTILLCDNHDVSRRPINLLQSYYLLSALPKREAYWLILRESAGIINMENFYRSYWEESKFHFVASGRFEAKISLTWRLPRLRGGKLEIYANNILVLSLDGETKWTFSEISIPNGNLRRGVNELRFIWPTPAFEGEAEVIAFADKLMRSEFVQPYQCFGEIDSLVVSVPGSDIGVTSQLRVLS